MLSLSDVSIHFGSLTILDRVAFTVNAGDRVGLVGPNGAGKSTLLRVIAGELTPETGAVTLQAGRRAGYLRQGFADVARGTLQSLLDTPLEGLIDASSTCDRLTARLAEADADVDGLLHTLEQETERFERAGGFAALDLLGVGLDRFGLGQVPWDTPLARLSGGEKTRAGLAALLATRPDVLLLDEPTNHLDLEGLEWLEGFVTGYPGAVVVVSHDRAFLDRVVNRIIALDDITHTATEFVGGYSAYAAERARAEAALVDAYERQQEQIARIERDVRAVAGHALTTEHATTNDYLRGRSKKVARTAKVRERKLERLLASEERIEKPPLRWGLALDLTAAGSTGDDVVVATGLRHAFGDRVILDGVDLLVRAGDRVALTGPNGAGKSTLLHLIAGHVMPGEGVVRRGAGVALGFFDQEQSAIALDRSPLEQIRAAGPGEESEARAFLHKFLFTGENVLRPAGELSYGERARLALALQARRGANVLLLDEPLNHLDIASRERFEAALSGFDGTVIIVLHDRYAVARLATRVLSLEHGKLVER